MDAKRDTEPLLGPKTEHRAQKRELSARWCRSRLIAGICVALVIALIVWMLPQSRTSRRSSPSSPERKHHFEHNGSSVLNYTRTELLDFNVPAPQGYGSVESISVWETLNSCHYHWNATGKLRLARGETDQKQAFLAVANIAADSQMALDSVQLAVRSDQHTLYVRCAEFTRVDGLDGTAIPGWNGAVDVDLVVFVKPHTLQFGQTRINTNALGIIISEDLDFETYHMSLFSAHGDIVGEEMDAFTAHDIQMHTSNGAITGNWSLPGSIKLSTGAFRSVDKPIDIYLAPKRWSSGPQTGGVLEASTHGGDITIKMPLAPEMLSLRNMSIDISSKSGSIMGSFQTGIRTMLVTGESGSINATLLPDFALPVTSTILTSTDSGNVSVSVLPPVIDSYYKINPLFDTKSEHISASGYMRLQYPPEWAGTALGVSDAGDVSIAGDGVDHLMQDRYVVVARRGTGMGSRLDFKTHNGTGNLQIG